MTVWEFEIWGKRYILKDSWIIATRPYESVVLEDLQGVKGVPMFVAGGAVHHPELTAATGIQTPLTTTLLQTTISGQTVHGQEGCRVVEKPKAELLSSFVSQLEVCTAFQDYVHGKYDVCEFSPMHN
jgi:hypothetical protein